MIDEWRVDLMIDELGVVRAVLWEVDDRGQYHWLCDEEWKQPTTAQEVVVWLTRHWAGRARLRLR